MDEKNPYDITETTTHITEKVDGVDYKFRLMTPYDRIEIVKRIKAKARAELIGDCSDSGIDSEQKFAELASFRATWDEGKEFAAYVNCETSNAELSEMALGEPDAAKSQAIITKLRPRFGWLVFKAALLNLELTQAKPEGNTPPNPQTPPGTPGLTYGT